MSAVDTARPKRLTPAFARKLRRTTLLLVVCAVVAFGITTERLLRSHNRRFLAEQAQLCAAALIPGPNGDLSESVERVRSRYDRLIAVATLDAFDNLYMVYPERPAHRRAVLSVLADGTDPVAMTSPDDGESLTISGVVVPLNGSPSPTARKVVILLRSDSYGADWVGATTMFALLVGVVGILGAESVRRWFDRRIARPLRNMATVVTSPFDGMEHVPTLEPGGWRETAEIARRFHELFRNMAETGARARRMERQAERRLRKRQLGFDRQLRRAKDRATLDPLTRLRNRRFFEEELGPLFERCQAKDGELAAVMFDLDNFKHYNDTHGHQVGDTLLRFVGALLRGAIRPTDHAIRYGGDEFLLLMPDANAKQAAAIAERLVKLFGQYATRLGRDHHLSISAGVATLKADVPENGQDLVAKADAALYTAKRRGKNTVAGPCTA
ncbi:MAG: GGDEF domain-containing protein [Phycisphaerae bacterium]